MENNQNVQRLPAEQQYREEIDALIRAEKDWVPAGWKMSPRSVLTYITGGKADGVEITPKYIGSRRLVESPLMAAVRCSDSQDLAVPGSPMRRRARSVTRVATAISTRRLLPMYLGWRSPPST